MRRTALLAVVISSLATLALAGGPTPQDLLPWVPADATVVIGVDSAALRTQPLIQQWLLDHQESWSGHDADFDRFLSEAGLDPLRDVDAMVVTMSSVDDEKGVLALFGGRYDPSSLGAALAKRGGTATKVNGVDMYVFASEVKSPGHDEGAVALPSAELVMAGDPATVRAALAPPRPRANLATTEIKAGHVDPRSHFWVLAVVPEEVRAHSKDVKIETDDEGGEIVRGLVTAGGTVQRVAMQARLGKELELEGWALSDTKENADLLRDTARGAVAAMRLHFKDQAPELVEVLRDVDIEATDAEVTGKAEIPLELIQKWAAEARDHHHGECEQATTK